MPIGWMVMAVVPLVGYAASPDVTAYFTAEGGASTSAARRIATTTLKKAGVTLRWGAGGLRGAEVPRALRIELVEGPPDDQSRAVSLAVSYPRARCSKSITVFIDRIRALAGGPNRESALLAYVLAHEIGHVIQGVSRHSTTGVMKASWNEADRAALFAGRLGFEDVDVQLMRAGLSTIWCGTEAAHLTGRSGPGTAVHPE